MDYEFDLEFFTKVVKMCESRIAILNSILNSGLQLPDQYKMSLELERYAYEQVKAQSEYKAEVLRCWEVMQLENDPDVEEWYNKTVETAETWAEHETLMANFVHEQFEDLYKEHKEMINKLKEEK